jgi:hypothetical protein
MKKERGCETLNPLLHHHFRRKRKRERGRGDLRELREHIITNFPGGL